MSASSTGDRIDRFARKPAGELIPRHKRESWLKTDILQQCQLEIFRGVGAGLFNLSATFEMVGEPAPTGLLRMVQYLS